MEYKVFVGNVPYQSTQQEFEECFKEIDGYIKAEIITGYKTSISRGFGFVTVKTNEDIEKLKKRTDIVLNNRQLRFTSYSNIDNTNNVCTPSYNNPNLTINHSHTNKNRYSYTYKDNNYIFVNCIPEGKNSQWLKEKFHEYSPIGRCYIATNHDTGETLNNGFLEILDDNKYKSLIDKKYHTFDDVVLETTRYRIKN